MRTLILWTLLLAPVFGQRKPVTLESLAELSARTTGPGAPIWAPDGKTFAYRQGSLISIYDPARKRAKDLVIVDGMDVAAVPPADAERFDWENRRVREAALQWTPGGKELIFVTHGDVFLIQTATGKWTQLTRTATAERDVKVSPDGRLISFRREWDLWALDLTTQKETRLTTGGTPTLRNGGLDWVYPEELTLGTAYWWSPDSRSVAYLQFDIAREPVYPHQDLRGPRPLLEPQRYPQAGDHNAEVRLGIVGAAGGPTRWLDVGDSRNSYLIARAGWTPDSRNVYVVRMNRVQNRLELMSIASDTGNPTTLLKESDPFWINLAEGPYFLKDGKRFLWMSERDGFRHLYLYSNTGSDPIQLTRGSWEVTSLSGVDEPAGRVFYTSSEPGPLERHLYSVNLSAGEKRKITTEPGTHNISMGPGGTYFLDTFSNLTTPWRATLRTPDGGEVAVYREADRTAVDQYDLQPTEVVSFVGPDGSVLYAHLTKPAGFNPANKYPAIVNVYGGPGAQGVRNMWRGAGLEQLYAQRGFVVWQVDNRGSTGRGHAFESSINRHLGKTELTDQRAGIAKLVSLGYVDPARIGVFGWSYGGFMTLNLLLNAPDLFRAGIAGAPVTNWSNYDTIYTERYMGLPSDNEEGYRSTALPPVAGNLKAKLLILHNMEDDNVLFQNTMQMIDALQRAGKQFEMMIYPQKAHSVTGLAARQMDATMVEFFERNLKPTPSPARAVE